MITWSSKAPIVPDVFCWLSLVRADTLASLAGTWVFGYWGCLSCWALWLPFAVNVSIEAWSYDFWISVSLLEICKLLKWDARVEEFICSGKSPTHTHQRIVIIHLTISTFFLKELNFLEYSTCTTLMSNHLLPGLNDLLISYKCTLYAFMCLWQLYIDYLNSLLLSTVFPCSYPRYFSVFMVVINRLIFSWSGQHLDVYIVSNGLPNKYFDQMPAKHQPSNFSCTAEVIEQSNYRLENYIHSMYTEKLIKGCKRINEKMCSIA